MIQPSSVSVSAFFWFSTHSRRLYFTNGLLLRITNGLINLQKIMSKKILLSLVLASSVTCGTVAQSVLSDNFNGSTINSSLWQTSTPFSDSSITESGGNAIYQNRG